MKNLITFSFIIALAFSTRAADIKVATVDLQRLLKEYYRAEEVARQLEARHDAVFKELTTLRLDGQKLIKEAQDLQARSLDSALTDAARLESKRTLELKLADLHAFELSYDQTRTQREAEFQNQAALANRRIVDDILRTTRTLGEAGGFNLVLNESKANPVLGDVLFTKGVDDLTEKVLASLNATKPTADRSAVPAESAPKH